MRYWIVGFKDWCEVRSSVNPPKEKVTTVSRPSTIPPKPRYWDVGLDGPWNPKPQKYIIKTTVFSGGKVLTVVPGNEFRKLTGLAAPTHGKMIELDNHDHVKELRELGKRYV